MNINFENGDCKTRAEYALVLHRMVNSTDRNDGIVTIHDIDEGNQLGEPRVIDPERLASFLAMAGIRGSSGAIWIHPRLLAIGPKSIAWFAPAAMREMFYRAGAMNAISGKRMPNPPLVFVAGDGLMKVFALVENKRPDAKTELFHAPFMNVYNHGGICLPHGSSVTIKADFGRIEQYEHIFFDSFGSHTHTDVTLFPGGHDALWLHLAESGETEFKSEWLKPRNEKLSEVLV